MQRYNSRVFGKRKGADDQDTADDSQKRQHIYIKPAKMNFLLTATSYAPPAMMTTKVKVTAVLVVVVVFCSSSISSSRGGQQQQATTTKMENSCTKMEITMMTVLEKVQAKGGPKMDKIGVYSFDSLKISRSGPKWCQLTAFRAPDLLKNLVPIANQTKMPRGAGVGPSSGEGDTGGASSICSPLGKRKIVFYDRYKINRGQKYSPFNELFI